MPVSTSKKVMRCGIRASTSPTNGAISSHSSPKRSSLDRATPSRVMRSVTESRWGLVYRPGRSPKPCSRASTIRAVLLLPFVPVRWIDG